MIVETLLQITQFVHQSTFGNPTHCGIAILVAFFDTRTVLTLASKAFAFYYTLQCLVTLNVSRNRNQRIGIALVAVALGFKTTNNRHLKGETQNG